jgi:hypothetical protein
MITLKREPNWPTLLGHFFSQNSTKAFEWGEWDCALMAADAVKTITGHDYAESLRFQYTDAKGALALIKPYGDLCGLIDHLLAGQSIDAKNAMRGDVAVVENADRQCAGIVWGSGVFATGQDGLVLVPSSKILQAWRV